MILFERIKTYPQFLSYKVCHLLYLHSIIIPIIVSMSCTNGRKESECILPERFNNWVTVVNEVDDEGKIFI